MQISTTESSLQGEFKSSLLSKHQQDFCSVRGQKLESRGGFNWGQAIQYPPDVRKCNYPNPQLACPLELQSKTIGGHQPLPYELCENPNSFEAFLRIDGSCSVMPICVYARLKFSLCLLGNEVSSRGTKMVSQASHPRTYNRDGGLVIIQSSFPETILQNLHEFLWNLLDGNVPVASML